MIIFEFAVRQFCIARSWEESIADLGFLVFQTMASGQSHSV
jgi:hypothetical protein